MLKTSAFLLNKLQEELFIEISKIPIIDIHTHIDYFTPFAKNLAEIIGYHYYTELACSSGFNKNYLDSSPYEMVKKIVTYLPYIEHTIQYSWLIDLCKFFFNFKDNYLTNKNIEFLYHKVEEKGRNKNRLNTILEKSNIKKIVLTNNFDEDLEKFTSSVFIPSLRADELVFKIQDEKIRERLAKKTKKNIKNIDDFEKTVNSIFKYFKNQKAALVTIGIPPDFRIFKEEKKEKLSSDFNLLIEKNILLPSLSAYIMEKIVENCANFSFPIQLMIGAQKNVYKNGIFLGQDLFNSNWQLTDYSYLFNKYPQVNFLISVLPNERTHQQLAFGWLMHNVYPTGHWWYANLPEYISSVLTARLQSIPSNKLIGYYSDAYKIEFILPKFLMYKKILSQVLAKKCTEHQITKDKALELSWLLLYHNPTKLLKL